MNKATKERANTRSLLKDAIENVSKEAFSKHYKEITELIGHSHGVYALYDGTELYYVGKSTELRKRVKQHLHDRHLASWTRFSLFLVRRVEHIHEIESLLVKIANPKGNRVVPKGKSSGQLLAKLKVMVEAKHRKEYEELFSPSGKNKKTRVKEVTNLPRTLEGLVDSPALLSRAYKGKDYSAKLNPDGSIVLGGKRYSSPTVAAKVITKGSPRNGRRFWYIRNKSGVWVRLAEYEP